MTKDVMMQLAEALGVSPYDFTWEELLDIARRDRMLLAKIKAVLDVD